jgi:hypothetical protein
LTSETIIAWDFESWLIQPARQLPRAVCMSWAEIVQNAATPTGYAVGRSGLVTAAEGIGYLERWLRAGVRLIGAETAFDALLSVVNAPNWKELLRLWVDAYEAGRIHDVLIRQKLLDLAAGCYRYEDTADGVKPAYYRYNLAALALRLCGRKLDKPVGEDDVDHWRLRFGELDGLPIASYPPAAAAYALEDAIATAEVWIAQEHERRHNKRIARNFPGYDPLLDEVRQTMAAVPLKAMSAYGLRTDPAAVERLAVEVEAKILETRAELVDAKGEDGKPAPLVRPPEYSRNTDAIVSYIVARGLDVHFRNEAGQIHLIKKRYLAAWEATQDPHCWRLANYLAIVDAPDSFRTDLDALVAAGLVDVSHTRDTKAAQERCFWAYYRQGAVAPRTDSYSEKEHGPLKTDDGRIYLNLNCISLDSDACEQSDDPILQLYSEYQSLAKTLANDIPMLRAGAVLPVHSRFETLLETGRTSSSKPNVQNVRRLPGIRECFVPRDGCVFVDVDFAMLELHTLAQVCLWVLGYSHLGTALNAGKDPHLMIAARIMRKAYDECKALKEAGDSELDNARTAGKGLNFGKGGALGVDTFVIYAWTNYRIRLTRERVVELFEIYDSLWTEVPEYHKWIKSLKDPFFFRTFTDPKTGEEKKLTRFNVVQPWSGRLRARAKFCAACNTPFQGLGADVAKRALWLAWRATVGLSELGEADPLYGCHIVNFVHDSIMVEAPEARAHDAALRLQALMQQASAEILRDVPGKADIVVTRRWSKKAQQWREPCGSCGSKLKCKCDTWASRRIIPWDLGIACREALDGYLRTAAGAAREPDKALAYLKGKAWPTDAARAAVAAVYGNERIAA